MDAASDTATFASDLVPVRTRSDRKRRPATRASTTARKSAATRAAPSRADDASRQPTASEEDENAPDTHPKRVRFELPAMSGAAPVAGETLRIIPERFEQFERDSAREFADANKPPWAPNVAPSTLRKVRDWHVLEVYDYAHLRERDWFAFLELVSGAAVAGDISLFIDNQARSQSARDVAPSRVGESRFAGIGRGGSDFGALGQLGTAGLASPFVRFQGGAGTVFAPDDNQPDIDTRGTFMGDGQTAAQQLAAILNRPGEGTASATDRPDQFTTTREDRTEAVIASAVAKAANESGQPLAQSGGRFKLKRAELDLLHTPPWFAEGQSDDAREARRQARLNAQKALPWITRSLSTGVFYLNPAYVWALAEAHAWTQSLGGAGMRDVPRAEFMRRRSHAETHGRLASATVRTLFAQLVAEAYAERRDRQGRGVRFQHDSQRITQAANGVLAQLRRFYYYDSRSRLFVDRRSDERAAGHYTPLYSVASQPRGGRGARAFY